MYQWYASIGWWLLQNVYLKLSLFRYLVQRVLPMQQLSHLQLLVQLTILVEFVAASFLLLMVPLLT